MSPMCQPGPLPGPPSTAFPESTAQALASTYPSWTAFSSFSR